MLPALLILLKSRGARTERRDVPLYVLFVIRLYVNDEWSIFKFSPL